MDFANFSTYPCEKQFVPAGPGKKRSLGCPMNFKDVDHASVEILEWKKVTIVTLEIVLVGIAARLFRNDFT